ncbi:methionine biosynthesis protein MetW [Rhodomicrobium vannielii ATCC 17100]|uniref:Methionine biosynthesis protein MetW n=1 Tax=Rhodomicrobium vannielii (strain ATCC 17100 / DSM 162 / LMG 4299 / NCIMB 10020 / ATH 3.1.1) TaxID=648757 RepID=E3I591_RHOVT|nr:methionine biosynthesis protein MetW [Rhodomicrobium vannielii]ADP70541.1 methionine biosynthesis protein MetW [Rhodomicrobium vannielii ATCC 17100]
MTAYEDSATFASAQAVQHRIDLLLIAGMVEDGARVLDVGCGTGQLLKLLEEKKNVDGRGIELSQSGVNFCVAKGLSVIQGDADHDLVNYPDLAFDYAILSQTLQATTRPKEVLQELLRIARHVIVSFPNFGHWRIRTQILFNGRMPVTWNLPEAWYETPNIHFCTIADFRELCDVAGARVERSFALSPNGRPLGSRVPAFMHNIVAQQAVFLLTAGDKG